MIVADTSGLLAVFNRREPRHDAVVKVVEGEDDPLVVSPYVVAELDYLMATRQGTAAERAVLEELSSGAYLLAEIGERDLRRAAGVVGRWESPMHPSSCWRSALGPALSSPSIAATSTSCARSAGGGFGCFPEPTGPTGEEGPGRSPKPWPGW
jgi:uncharacterized protein with PIN domain